jgi:hypothetical protein
MINNKHNLKVGDTVLLDAKYRNGSKVKIIALSPNGMFSHICPIEMTESDGWDVMTNRLTPII